MSYLPINLRLTGSVILFGFGKVGQRKFQVLKDIAPRIVVVDEILPPNSWSQYTSHKFVEKRITGDNFQEIISRNTDLVIVALSDPILSQEIADYCNQTRILVNVVDRPGLCSIIFPAMLRQNVLSIAISTNGKCPFYAKYLKAELSTELDRFEKECNLMTDLRELSSDPKEDLNRIVQDIEFLKLLKQQNYSSALQRGREIIGDV